MPGARRGFQNNNRNDIAHMNLGFFAVLKHVDISNKTQLSAGQNSCDIHLVSQLRRVDPSLWICPIYFLKAAFYGPMV